jgi:hypothetical protein
MKLAYYLAALGNGRRTLIAISTIAVGAAAVTLLLLWSAPSRVLGASFACETRRSAALEATATSNYAEAQARVTAITDFELSLQQAVFAASMIVSPPGRDPNKTDIESLDAEAQRSVAADIQRYQENSTEFVAAYERVRSFGDFGYGILPNRKFEKSDSSLSNDNFLAIRRAAVELLDNEKSYQRVIERLRPGALDLEIAAATRARDVESDRLRLLQISAASFTNARPDWSGAISDECGGNAFNFRVALFRASL